MEIEKKQNSKCVKFAKFILVAVNAIFLILGVAVTGLALTLVLKAPSFFKADQQAILSTTMLYGAAAFGAILMVVAVVGIVGAMKGDGCCGKMFTLIYSLILLAIIVAQLAIVAVAFIEAGKFGAEIKNKTADATAKATDAVQDAINSYVNTTYIDCCAKAGVVNTNDLVCKNLNDVVKPKKGKNMCGKSEADFRFNVLSMFEGLFKQFGIGAVVCAVVEIVCLIAACHIMRKAGNNGFKAGEYANGGTNTNAPVPNTGGEIAFGTRTA